MTARPPSSSRRAPTAATRCSRTWPPSSTCPLAANCVSVTLGDPITLTRVRWGGSLLEEARLHGSPALLTVAPHAVAADPAADAS